mmetsp:Transcript_33241/g.75735  ORF Transcript_33241/g.75735 Transcript_33241/m.75735 type:complete len:205 (-) Transcript_33241:9-623(-)
MPARNLCMLSTAPSAMKPWTSPSLSPSPLEQAWEQELHCCWQLPAAGSFCRGSHAGLFYDGEPLLVELFLEGLLVEKHRLPGEVIEVDVVPGLLLAGFRIVLRGVVALELPLQLVVGQEAPTLPTLLVVCDGEGALLLKLLPPKLEPLLFELLLGLPGAQILVHVEHGFVFLELPLKPLGIHTVGLHSRIDGAVSLKLLFGLVS